MTSHGTCRHKSGWRLIRGMFCLIHILHINKMQLKWLPQMPLLFRSQWANCIFWQCLGARKTNGLSKKWKAPAQIITHAMISSVGKEVNFVKKYFHYLAVHMIYTSHLLWYIGWVNVVINMFSATHFIIIFIFLIHYALKFEWCCCSKSLMQAFN